MNAFYGRELADVAEFITDKDLLRSRCYIDGEWVAAGNGGVLPVFNPSSGKRIGSVPKLGAADARRAIEAAHAAFPSWRAKTAGERAAGLRRWHDLMLAAQEDLARLMTAEQGKPLAEVRALYRVRRRRLGCSSRGCLAVQVSQCRADLRLRQPTAGAGKGLRCLCGQADRTGAHAAGRPTGWSRV